jgi:hypothetical protein
MTDPMDAIRDIVYPGHRAPVTPINDDIQAASDDLRDVIERDLIVNNPPPTDWRPDPKDVC